MQQSVSTKVLKTVVAAIYFVKGPVSSVQSQCDLLQWLKVNVAELLFENAKCSCLKPPVTDSLLPSGSKEENMSTAPFKSCWRPCRSSPLTTSHMR